MKDAKETTGNAAEVITDVYRLGVEHGKRRTISSIARKITFCVCAYVVAWCAKRAFIADCKAAFGENPSKESK